MTDKEAVLNEFKARSSNLIAIGFDIPQIPLDTLHPQIKKTADSLKRELDKNDFLVFQHDYWTDEEAHAVILLELAVSELNNIKIHEGPKVYYRQACDNFIEKFGLEKLDSHINESNNNTTRFVIVSNKKEYVENALKHIDAILSSGEFMYRKLRAEFVAQERAIRELKKHNAPNREVAAMS